MTLRTRRIHGRIAAVASIAALAGAALASGQMPAGATTPRPAATPPATVGVNGLCGGVVTGTLPASLRPGTAVSATMHVYEERSMHSLGQSVPVDFKNPGLYSKPSSLPNPQPTIAASTLVNSYLVHSDPPGDSIVRRAATVGFTGTILGVEVKATTLSNNASKAELRGPATYANNVSGLELGLDGHGDYARLINAHTLSFALKTSSVVDEIRVITTATTSTSSALKGYRMLASDGGVFDFGGQKFYGSTGGTVLNKPVVAGQNTCGNAGYWFVASDGGVFSYGDAPFYGSAGGTALSSPVVGMAVTATGAGYYLVTATGQVLVYGDAQTWNNSAGHHDLQYLHLNQPIVGIATAPSGRGYWLVASDGGIFAFGSPSDAGFFGSTGNLHLNKPIIGMYAAKDGDGYYLYASDGGMFVFGHEPFFGSAGGTAHTNPIVGARLASDGQGYWFVDSAGKIFQFGPSAPFAGDMSAVKLFRPMIGMM
ncbi:MAG TPA: hypothetical protein VH914_09920 [Acidimicrobiia bacterium]|jgi:hypothetical protein|nr:hypothetical protein [Acidimicrobiia bacterium]